MSGDIRVEGAEGFLALARRLKETGNRELRLELYRSIRQVTNPIRENVRKSARETLPRRGGLGALIASSKIRVQRRASGASVGIRMVGSSEHDIAAMNAGIVRHPLYGNKRHWFEQAVRPRWWDEPTEEAAPLARVAIVDAMERVKRKIEG